MRNGGSGGGSGAPNRGLVLVAPAGAQAGQPILKPTYDETEFFAGRRGKSNAEMVRLEFKVHEGYAAEGEKWLRSNRIAEYSYMSDLLRHAYVRHLRHFLPSIAGQVEGSLLHEMAQIDEVAAGWEFQNKFVKQIEWVAEQVNATLQMPGGRREVERKLRKIKRMIDATRPSFYRSVYLKMFNDRFGVYLQRLGLVDYDGSVEAEESAGAGDGDNGPDAVERLKAVVEDGWDGDNGGDDDYGHD